MEKAIAELTDRDKWFIGFILGRVSPAILFYMGMTEEEVWEYNKVYNKIADKFPYTIGIDRLLKDNPWDLVDSRKWNITKKEE